MSLSGWRMLRGDGDAGDNGVGQGERARCGGLEDKYCKGASGRQYRGC